MKPLISIIIPVYNAEKYIRECLESVISQDFQDYEVLVVNDGSKDGSLKICEEFSEKNKKIKIYSTENKGVSHARNYGMKQASGKWLMFLDSDDYLIEGCLKRLEAQTFQDVQEICGNYLTKGSKQLQVKSALVKPEELITMILDPVNHQTLPDFYHLECATLLGVWGKLFLREIVERLELRFDEKLKLSEDMIFHIQYLKNIENVLLLNDSIFYYRENETSVTKNFKAEYIENRRYLFEQLKAHQIFDAVFATSTMLQLNVEMESAASGAQRAALEKEFESFWKNEKDMLAAAKGKRLSAGKWQNIAYQVSSTLLQWDRYKIAFLFLRIYGKIR